jgi:hypothetical protein
LKKKFPENGEAAGGRREGRAGEGEDASPTRRLPRIILAGVRKRRESIESISAPANNATRLAVPIFVPLELGESDN